MATDVSKPPFAQHIEVTGQSVIVDGQDISSWVSRHPVTIEVVENGLVDVHVVLTATHVTARVDPNPA